MIQAKRVLRAVDTGKPDLAALTQAVTAYEDAVSWSTRTIAARGFSAGRALILLHRDHQAVEVGADDGAD